MKEFHVTVMLVLVKRYGTKTCVIMMRHCYIDSVIFTLPCLVVSTWMVYNYLKFRLFSCVAIFIWRDPYLLSNSRQINGGCWIWGSQMVTMKSAVLWATMTCSLVEIWYFGRIYYHHLHYWKISQARYQHQAVSKCLKS
jgi:hypothetical protein